MDLGDYVIELENLTYEELSKKVKKIKDEVNKNEGENI